MDRLDGWIQLISEGKIDGALQNEIADKILMLLEQENESMSAWRKFQFARAITGLSINVNSISQPTEAGLTICLIALQRAMVAEKEPDNSNEQSDDLGELFNYARLLATVQKIKGQIV